MIPIKQYYTDKIKDIYFKSILLYLKQERIKEIEKYLKQNDFTLKDLFVGDVKTLRKIIKSNNLKKIDLTKEYKYFRIKKSKNENKHIIYNIKDLIEQLKIAVCPYCNRTFIYSTIRTKEIKTTCQVDHFFNKKEYPYLSLSLYNLIPVCGSCNHSKLDKSFSLSPLEIEDVDNGIQFNLNYKKPDYTNPDAFCIETIIIDPKLKDQANILGIKKIYEKHNDIGHELFIKHLVYSNDRVQELLKSFPKLFSSKEELERLIIGNFIGKEDVGKRPLAKMTRDIMRQLNEE